MINAHEVFEGNPIIWITSDKWKEIYTQIENKQVYEELPIDTRHYFNHLLDCITYEVEVRYDTKIMNDYLMTLPFNAHDALMIIPILI